MSDDNAHASRIAEQLAMYANDDSGDIDECDDEPGEGGDSGE